MKFLQYNPVLGFPIKASNLTVEQARHAQKKGNKPILSTVCSTLELSTMGSKLLKIHC